MTPWRRIGSLRGKLIMACVLVELAATALLALASSRLLQHTLTERLTHQVGQIATLLDQVIAAPLGQRDYATLQQSLDLLRDADSINYLVLWNHRDVIVAASGWDTRQPLPPRDEGDIDFDRADTTLHLSVPVSLAGQQLGRLDLGLATTALRQARSDFLWRSAAVGALALVISAALLALIALTITRHLAQLARASQRMADGDFDARVEVQTNDEIGRLGASFNSMAGIIQQRVAALEQSESQQRLHLVAVREEQARLHTLLGAMRDGILFADAAGRVVYANASFARIWGLPGLRRDQPLHDIVPLMLCQTSPASHAFLLALLDAQASEDAAAQELHTLDGRIIAQRMQPVGDAGARKGCIWFHDDITLARQTEQRARQALHDPLTKLLNRRGLFDALQPALQHAGAEQQPLTLMFIDLDDFKLVNDVGGHRAGDEVLQAVAIALSAQLRRGELVARLGGDEFAVMCPGLDAEDAAPVAVRLVEAVAAVRYTTAEHTLRLGCSIGLATYPQDALAQDELIACADTAMYQAKQSGKNGWARYLADPGRALAETSRVDWNARIHRALQEARLVLHFQPVYKAADMQLSHHEALLRMVDEADAGRLISPDSFIGHAERSGKILLVDRWVFQTCVEKLAATAAAVAIAANLSARSLEDACFPAFLRDLLQRHDVDPRRLHIELTETSAISDPVAARQMVAALGALGCAVHLDDFGSGFSSFAQLKLLDVDVIKIDGSFIRDLAADTSNRLFVAAMIDVAHHLHKQTVAEHVEDAATLEILRGLGIDMVQGYHLGRPNARFADGSDAPALQVVRPLRRGAAASRDQ